MTITELKICFIYIFLFLTVSYKKCKKYTCDIFYIKNFIDLILIFIRLRYFLIISLFYFSLVVRELKKRNIAVAGVIYPATPLLASRIRINVSVGHTKQDLDQVSYIYICLI